MTDGRSGLDGDRIPAAFTDAVPELVGDDPVMNLIVLLGPVAVAAVAVFGRTAVGVAVAAAYVAGFALELGVRAARHEGESSHPDY